MDPRGENVMNAHSHEFSGFIREFKQIATAGADTAAESKFPQK